MDIRRTPKQPTDVIHGEEGHTYAYGGASLVAIVLLILLLVWLL